LNGWVISDLNAHIQVYLLNSHCQI